MRNLDRDDVDFDAVLRGSVPGDRPELDAVVALVEDLRLSATAAARPNSALAVLLAEGLPPAPAAAPVSHLRRAAPAVTWAAAVSWTRSVRTTVKAAVLATVAVVSVTSAAAAAGALPDPIQEKLSTAVKTVTPWEIPRPNGNGGIGEIVREKARHHGQDKDKDNKGVDKDKGVDAPKSNNGNGNGRPSDAGRPANPGKSEASKPADDASKSPKPTHAATPPKPAHAATPTKPAQAATPSKPAHPAKPSVANVAPGRPDDPGAEGRSKAAERKSLRGPVKPSKAAEIEK